MSFNQSGGGSNQISTATDVFLSSLQNGQVLSYNGSVLKWVNAAAATGSGTSAASFLFSSQTASITASVAVRVAANATVGQCRLSVTGAPAGSNLVVILQVSTNGGTSWSPVQSLTIVSGSTSAVSANPNFTISAGDLVRVNATSVGSTTAATGVLFQADYS